MSAETTSNQRYRSTPVSRQASELLLGPSIVTQLRNSSYGRFHEYLQESGLQALQQDFQLPRVIVIGGRSAGKSSLLESITKCPIFPRHRDFCTKMPIELHMKNDPTAIERHVSISYPNRKPKQAQAAHEILAEVNAIMQSVSGIHTEPIIIEIRQADVPTFEFVDLPGIQTYPEEQERATTQLVNAYLNKPNTLVLCVVDATTAAFDTSVALKLIRNADKLANTIVAMTKSDLVTTAEEYEHKIFNRILGKSSDNEHLKDLAGCVAVANRQARSETPLAEADAAERLVFSSMLHDPAKSFASKANQRLLKQNMTVMQLIVQLDRLFHSFIVRQWKPAALQKIKALLAATQSRLSGLGPPVSELTADGVLLSVLKQVNLDALCEDVRTALHQTALKNIPDVQPQLYALDNDCSLRNLAWVANMSAIDDRTDLLVENFSSDAHNYLLNTVQTHLTQIFEQDPPPKLKRFSDLQLSIIEVVLPAYITNMLVASQSKLQHLAEGIMADLCSCEQPNTCSAQVSRLDSTLGSCMLLHVMRGITSEIQDPFEFKLPEGFVLAEDVDVQQQRAAWKDEMAKFQTAHEQIACIEDAFSVPDSPTAAAAAAATAVANGTRQSVSTHPLAAVASPPPSATLQASDSTAVVSDTNHIAVLATTLQASNSSTIRSTATASSATPHPVQALDSDEIVEDAMAGIRVQPDPNTSHAAQIQAEFEDMPASPASSVAESYVHLA